MQSRTTLSLIFDTSIKASFIAWDITLNLYNLLGKAYWAKVETLGPEVIYYIGPYINKNSLKRDLITFKSDLNKEGAFKINIIILRRYCAEPLTYENNRLRFNKIKAKN